MLYMAMRWALVSGPGYSYHDYRSLIKLALQVLANEPPKFMLYVQMGVEATQA